MTTDLWLALLAIVSTIAAGLMYMGKKKADVALTEVQIELARVKNEASEFDQLMQLIHNQATQFQSQLEINQAQSTTIQKVSDVNEQNYQVLKQVWDRHTAEIMDNSRKTGERIINHVDKLPELMAAAALEGLKQVTAELAVQMAEIMRQTVTRFEANVFPSLRDRRWAEAYVHPKNSIACLFDEPRFQEPARNLTPESCMKGEERCWVIEEVMPGFHAVRRGGGKDGVLLVL